MGPIKEILAETQFQEELTSSSQTKLVVVDFTASWCGPCQTIAPFYEQLSRKYPNAVFLKVDVDKCQETAVNQRVSVMPTFHFYRNKVKVDSMQGADPQKLEEKIQKYYDDGMAENDVGVAGHVRSSKKSKQTPTKKPVKRPKSDTKRESKSSNDSKKKMSKHKKKALGKLKEKRENDDKQEPELEISRMVSTHDGAFKGTTSGRRRTFKDTAKKWFCKNSKKCSVEDTEERKRTPSQLTHHSFKSIMSHLFHPHRKASAVASADGESYEGKSKKRPKKKKT